MIPSPNPNWRLLSGKTAAITGGTTGIGRAIALEFLRQGCNVAVNHLGLDRDASFLDTMIYEAKEYGDKAGRLLPIAGDVTNPETGNVLVEGAVKQFGKLDIFVSNAGVCQFAEFLE